jgi:DNA polymerase
MSDFGRAVDLVRSQLEPWRAMGRGRSVRASRDALTALAAQPAGGGAPEPSRPTKEKRPPVSAAARPDRPPPAPSTPVPPPSPASPVSREEPLPELPPAEKAARIAALRESVSGCTRCPHLVATRTQVVFGVGNPAAELMFVGEAPGADEDRLGEPFVGRAGELLTKIIVAMGMSREEIFIANVLKCRPDMPAGSSGNRKPRAEEMETCLPYLREQIEIIRPKALVALGATAMEGLTGSVEPMAKLRGRWHEFHGIPLMATYHPAYLLRNQTLAEKRKVWEDMLKVLEFLGKPISAKQRGYFLPG